MFKSPRFLFSNGDISVFEAENILFNSSSSYWWGFNNDPAKLTGPFSSVLAATAHYEDYLQQKLAIPNVINVNFVTKQRIT